MHMLKEDETFPFNNLLITFYNCTKCSKKGLKKPNDHHFCTNAGAVLFRKRLPRFPFLSIKPLFFLSLIL